VPLVNQILVKEADILNILDQMRTSIPDEIKQARRIIQNKERFLAQAHDDASKIIEHAQENAREAVTRENLLRLADEKAEKIKVEADAYVVETLQALRDHLTSIEMDIDRSILSIDKGLASLEMEVEEAEEEAYEVVLPDEEQGASPTARTTPRSASLAVDTMGGPMYQQDSIQKKD
jgi:hypothetical protein